MRLLVLQVGRIHIGHHPVAVPFDKCNAGICSEHSVDNIINKFLYLRVGEIENKLIPEIMLGTVR